MLVAMWSNIIHGLRIILLFIAIILFLIYYIFNILFYNIYKLCFLWTRRHWTRRNILTYICLLYYILLLIVNVLLWIAIIPYYNTDNRTFPIDIHRKFEVIITRLRIEHTKISHSWGRTPYVHILRCPSHHQSHSHWIPNKSQPARITIRNTKQSPPIHSQNHPIHHSHQSSN